MPSDPRKLKPGELCRLLNSTPLGEVINERLLRRQRNQAGLRIGDGRHLDLLRYVAWLVQVRHTPKPPQGSAADPAVTLAAAAKGAAALGSRRAPKLGESLTGKQESLIAALLTEPTYAVVAGKVGVAEATMYRWLLQPQFRLAYRQARRELVESAIGRIQAASGQAVEALLTVAAKGRRDSDRVRAAVALLDRAFRGLAEADVFHGEVEMGSASPLDTADVVRLVAQRLGQLDQAELSTGEKSRLTATLAETLLKAIGVDVLDKRLEALQGVLLDRKDRQE